MFQLTQLSGFGGKSSSFNSYSQNVMDNGTDGYLAWANTLTMGSNSANLLLSAWVKLDSVLDTGTFIVLGEVINGTGQRIHMAFTDNDSTSVFDLKLGDTGVNDILSASSTETHDKTTRKHILIARSGTTLQVYIDDVVQTMSSAPGAGGFDYANMDSAQVGRDFSSNQTDGKFADVYVANEYLDISSASNRRKFIDAGGEPVDLGSDGSSPTGNQPAIFCGGSHLAADWNTGDNLGAGGDPAGNGTFTDVSF